MNTEGTNASVAGTKVDVAAEESPARETSKGTDEGIGVFRALLLTLLLYALGFLIWFAWHALTQGHAR